MPGSLVNQSTTVMDVFEIGEKLKHIFETEAYSRFLSNHLTAVVHVFDIHRKTLWHFPNRCLSLAPSQSFDQSSGCVRNLSKKSIIFSIQELMLGF